MKKHTKTHMERQAEKLGLKRNGMESDKAFRVRVGDVLAAKSNMRVIKQFKLPGHAGGLVSGETLAELREAKKKDKSPRLYVLLYRNNTLNMLPIYNMSSTEIRQAIARGVDMFTNNERDAQEFQDLCYAELHRRL